MRARLGIAAALVGLVALGGCATTTVEAPSAGGATAAATPATTAAATPATTYADLAPAEPTTDLPSMAVSQLPREGIETLTLIRDDGPFPYDQDGATFQNREGILPKQPRGFYAEYTVVTPGEDDRGARRIVAGDDGSRFYTADHYSSFREVVSG